MAEVIYAEETGSRRVSYSDTAFHGGAEEPSQHTGWRPLPKGGRELVFYERGQWVSDTERNSARVRARDFR